MVLINPSGEEREVLRKHEAIIGGLRVSLEDMEAGVKIVECSDIVWSSALLVDA